MKSILRFSIFTLFISLTLSTFAQKDGVIRCYTVENEAIRALENKNSETEEHFEKWLDSLITEKEKHRIIGGVYEIPVVFHVIHKGADGVGTGTNISQAALQSQIDVLNEDFRKKIGSNGYNTDPVGADCEIEFCLAQRKPDGSGFPAGQEGVNRVNSNSKGWGSGSYSTNFIDNTIKPATSWDPSRYMNIWIVDISGGILGYAQFPTSSLGGMGCGYQDDATDGVVFLYNSIGKSSVTGNPAPYNEGRTATHEIGHWLGLRHIWGDGGCSVDDYCNDTPLAGQPNYNCSYVNSCTAAPDAGPDMINNYMDYTNDLCMDIFTQDQKMRMRTVLESSPLRRSLINSDACIPPSPDDISIIDIINPVGDNCAGSISPTVVLKNRGSNTITTATISYTIDNGTVTTFNYNGSLASGATENISLPSFTTPLGVHTFTAYSSLPNGVVDPNPLYDTVQIQFDISNGLNAPFSEHFNGDVFPPSISWVVENENDDCFQWQGASAFSSDGQLQNNAIQFPGYGNTSNSTDNFITPIFILPCNASSADLKFDVAYQKESSGSNERLFIEISEDCGNTWNSSPIYDKSGSSLATVSGNNNDYFIPTSASQWRTETVDLTSFLTSTSKSIKFRIRAKGNNGNNIYVDNLEFNATTSAEINVAVNNEDVLDEGYYDFGEVAIGSPITAIFTVENTGNSDLILTPPLTLSGTAFNLTSTFGTTTITPGNTTTFEITFTAPTGGDFTGDVTFETNDCDEGTYNFVLKGKGAIIIPVADFTASPLNVCTGSTVSFTDESMHATSWDWDFGPNATPTNSTLQNPTVSYTNAGSYPVTLTVSNADGSDVETKSGYITVEEGSGAPLPLSEGFVSTTFPPTGWSIVNTNNSPTWERTTEAGNAPTTGNAMMFDNNNINDQGDNDQVVLKAVDLSNVSTAELTFDVAYAQYSSYYSDGLQVTIAAGCGATSTDVVYDKQGVALATAPNTANSFTPTSSQWRTETVDLTPYIGFSKVVVSFKDIAGYGNRLFVDNINVTGNSNQNPIASFTTTSTNICEGESVTFTNTSTGSPTSSSWDFPGGSPTSSSATDETVTYNTAGTYSVTLTVSNGIGTDDTTITNLITVTASPTFTSITPDANCGTGTATLEAIASGGVISWFTNASGGAALGTGTTFTTPTISNTTTFYAEITDNGCTTSRVPVIAEVLPKYIFTVSESVCFGEDFTFPDGTIASDITSTVQHTSNFTTQDGCDSIVETTVNPQIIETTVTENSSSLTANQVGAQYQWVNCTDSSFTNISGQTSQTFTPLVAGDYAVVLTLNGCSETSSCYHFEILSIKENPVSNLELNLYPNPSSGNVVLSLSEILDHLHVSILSVSGQLIRQNDYQATDKVDFDLSTLSNGVYYFKIRAKQTVQVIKFIKGK